LSRKGIKSHLVFDGQERLDYFDANPDYFQLIFMDNIMTKLHGAETCVILRERGYQGIIIGITGHPISHNKSMKRFCCLSPARYLS